MIGGPPPKKERLKRTAAYQAHPCPSCGCTSVLVISIGGGSSYQCWCCRENRGANEKANSTVTKKCDIGAPHHHYWENVHGVTHLEAWTGPAPWITTPAPTKPE